jgi:hypothetical protein
VRTHFGKGYGPVIRQTKELLKFQKRQCQTMGCNYLKAVRSSAMSIHFYWTIMSHPRRQQSSKLILFFQLLAYRMAGASAIIVWTSVASCIMFGILKYAGKLRVSPKDEQEGKTDPANNMDTFRSTFSATYTQKGTRMSVSRHASLYVTHSHTDFYKT